MLPLKAGFLTAVDALGANVVAVFLTNDDTYRSEAVLRSDDTRTATNTSIRLASIQAVSHAFFSASLKPAFAGASESERPGVGASELPAGKQQLRPSRVFDPRTQAAL